MYRETIDKTLTRLGMRELPPRRVTVGHHSECGRCGLDPVRFGMAFVDESRCLKLRGGDVIAPSDAAYVYSPVRPWIHLNFFGGGGGGGGGG